MKLMQNLVIKMVLGVGFLSIFSQNMAVAAVTTVPAITVQKLGNLNGKYITAFYALGSPAALAFKDDQVDLREIKKISSMVISADQMTFPAVQLEKSLFSAAYNYIVIVVSPLPGFSWKNGDDTIPQLPVGVLTSENQQKSRSALVIKKSDMDAFITKKGTETPYIIDIPAK
ncbi:MAG: hypothetical protein ACOYOK_08215 [Pseudobdellovibrionaceae bacterium]